MKHALQVLNYEKRKLINRLYEMQTENDYGHANFTDEDFQAVKRKVKQTDDAIKLIYADGVKSYPKEMSTKPIRPTR